MVEQRLDVLDFLETLVRSNERQRVLKAIPYIENIQRMTLLVRESSNASSDTNVRWGTLAATRHQQQANDVRLYLG